MTDDELIARNIDEASTFDDLATAEAITARNLAAHQAEIEKWLQGSSRRLPLLSPVTADVGRVYLRATGQFVRPRQVLTILKRKGKDYYVRTSYLLP